MLLGDVRSRSASTLQPGSGAVSLTSESLPELQSRYSWLPRAVHNAALSALGNTGHWEHAAAQACRLR